MQRRQNPLRKLRQARSMSKKKSFPPPPPPPTATAPHGQGLSPYTDNTQKCGSTESLRLLLAKIRNQVDECTMPIAMDAIIDGKNTRSDFHFTEFASMLDVHLTAVLNAIQCGRKAEALSAAMELAEGARSGMKQYSKHMQQAKFQLKEMCHSLDEQIDAVDGELLRANLQNRLSRQRAVDAIREKDILKAKSALQSSVVESSGLHTTPRVPRHLEIKDFGYSSNGSSSTPQSSKRRSSSNPFEDLLQDEPIFENMIPTMTENEGLIREPSRFARDSDAMTDTFALFQNNLNTMRDKFSAVEEIIALQKREQGKRIIALEHENNTLKKNFQKLNDLSTPRKKYAHYFENKDYVEEHLSPILRRGTPTTSPSKRSNLHFSKSIIDEVQAKTANKMSPGNGTRNAAEGQRFGDIYGGEESEGNDVKELNDLDDVLARVRKKITEVKQQQKRRAGVDKENTKSKE